MPKYKYVDGVKYRVVPQSVLGYALVREDSDNSLPAGGTEGQVLAKASNTDYDVEWSTVESGGGDSASPFVLIEADHPSMSETYTFTGDLESVVTAIENGALPFLIINNKNGDGVVSSRDAYSPTTLQPYDGYWRCYFESLGGEQFYFSTNDGSIRIPSIG